MIPPADSLLKYGNPVLINKCTDPKSPRGFETYGLRARTSQPESRIWPPKLHFPDARPLRVSHQQLGDSGPVPPPPKPKSPSAEATRQQCEEILDVILPPREWTEGNECWMQHVSSAPCTRADVINLEELLDAKIQQRQARITGICPIRQELHSQCFDELIRQVTINCAERGLLLLRVRDEIQMTLAAYQALYESSVAFGIRKVLQGENGKNDMEKRVENLENEVKDLKKQLNEEKAKCEILEKREAEKRLLEERKHIEATHLLKRTNEQLKAQIEQIIASKR